MDKRSLTKAVAGAATVFGVAAVAAPTTVQRAYGVMDSADTRALLRLWGASSLTLSALAMRARDKDLDDLLFTLLVMNAADVGLAVYGGLRDGLPARTAALSGATSAAFAGVLGHARRLS
jgi:hypothetical protein